MHIEEVVVRKNPQPSTTVGDFLLHNPERLTLRLGEGHRFTDKVISHKQLQKLGMALTGFTDYLEPGIVYVFGNAENRFLSTQTPERRREIFAAIDPALISCILMTNDLPTPVELEEFALGSGIPVLATNWDSSTAMYVFTEYFETCLSPLLAVHGLLMDVFGVGALILGESGIGKSECALELILRGHRIVSDDMVEIRAVGNNRLIGSAPPQIQNILEMRGIGIVDVRELIGVSAIRKKKHVNFIIELIRWEPGTSYDRLGLSVQKKEFFGAMRPFMTIPVAAGRNIATLVEVACRVYLIREHGRHPMGSFLNFIDPGGEYAGEEGEEP